MRTETVRAHPKNNRVCNTCFDKDHPQNFLPYYITVDAEALRNARPDTGLAASRKMYPPGNWPPYPPPPGAAPAPHFRDDQERAR